MTTKYQLRLTEDQHQTFSEAAKSLGVSLADFMRLAATEKVERLQKDRKVA